jgi:hypothetical protein
MNLIKKYATKTTEEEKKAFGEILDLFRSHNETKITISNIQNIFNSNNVPFPSATSSDMDKTFKTLSTEDRDECIDILSSLAKDNNLKAIVIVGLVAIFEKLSKETFDFVNKTIDFKAFEKKSKIKFSKYFKNKTSSQRKKIEDVIKVFLEVRSGSVYTHFPTPFSSDINAVILNALCNRYKEEREPWANTNLSNAISAATTSTNFLAIKRFLGLVDAEEVDQEKYDNFAKDIVGKVVIHNSEKICKVVGFSDIKESTILRAFSNSKYNGIAVSITSAERFSENKIVYFAEKNLSSYSELTIAKGFTESDFDYIKNGKQFIHIGYDDSSYGRELNNRFSNCKIADFDAKAIYEFKNLIEDYEPENFLGSIISVECSNLRKSARSYGMIYSVGYNSEGSARLSKGLYVTVLVADMLNDHISFENYSLDDIIYKKKSSQMKAMLFYQDLLHLEQVRRSKILEQQVNRDRDRMYR